MSVTDRSACPINLAVELLGDRWTLLVLRDIALGGRRHFRELQRESQEGITSSVLADRLRRLLEAGVLVRGEDPGHRQRASYHLTEAGVQLVPVLAAIGAWGGDWLPADPELVAAGRDLRPVASRACDALMQDLREQHGATDPLRGR